PEKPAHGGDAPTNIPDVPPGSGAIRRTCGASRDGGAIAVARISCRSSSHSRSVLHEETVLDGGRVAVARCVRQSGFPRDIGCRSVLVPAAREPGADDARDSVPQLEHHFRYAERGPG